MYYLLHKNAKSFSLIESKKIFCIDQYWHFIDTDNALMFWRQKKLHEMYYSIQSYFRKHLNCYHHIFLNITNLNTNKPIQYLIVDRNYNEILNKFQKGFKILKSLGEEFSLCVYYKSYKNNTFIDFDHFERVIHSEYNTANILTSFINV